MVRLCAGVAVLMCLACSAWAGAGDDDRYHIHFSAHFGDGTRWVEAVIQLDQPRQLMREIDFVAPHSRYRGFHGDGVIRRAGDRVIWLPPAQGGSLRYRYRATQKKAAAYDARLTRDWAILRLDDLYPRARVRALRAGQGDFSVQHTAPEAWALESRYGDISRRKPLPPTQRKYQRPTGWFIGGELGVRRARIGNRRVVLAAPRESGFRRMDTLAFLRWTIPHLVTILPDLDQQLLVVGAPASMWYGGLSAPGSIFVHSDLPLISENGSSVLLHELAHLGGLHSATTGADWLVEGLAEYYSFEVLRRSGGHSDKRFATAMDAARRWVEQDNGQLTDPSHGADTMAAVLYFDELAQRLQQHGHKLDEVVQAMLASGDISREQLQQQVHSRLGTASVKSTPDTGHHLSSDSGQ